MTEVRQVLNWQVAAVPLERRSETTEIWSWPNLPTVSFSCTLFGNVAPNVTPPCLPRTPTAGCSSAFSLWALPAGTHPGPVRRSHFCHQPPLGPGTYVTRTALSVGQALPVGPNSGKFALIISISPKDETLWWRFPSWTGLGQILTPSPDPRTQACNTHPPTPHSPTPLALSIQS